MAVVKDAAINIDATAKAIHQTVIEAVGPDHDGVVASANISESFSNLNAATANMADDTAALKHNFPVRGFFRHRGYHNLTHLNPDSYRKDKIFADATNYRAWLSATELFHKRRQRGRDSFF